MSGDGYNGSSGKRTRVVHVIQQMTLGGASRALVATSKYSARSGSFEHVVISLVPSTSDGLELAGKEGIKTYDNPSREVRNELLASADIVHINWWNSGQMQRFLREELPAMRVLIWYHVAGDHAPQEIIPSIVRFGDLNVATNPYTFKENPLLNELRVQGQGDRVAMVLDPADLERVSSVKRKEHIGFNVGYIGTVDFYKMHPGYVRMSSKVEVPGIQFMVCGGGKQELLRAEARKLGTESRFQFLGYVKDICPVLSIMDIYGYPLCEETYASGELNIQEVMACGIPPVVFPYGGVKELIKDHYDGLVVDSEKEYVQAIEYLYHNDGLRNEIGSNAYKSAWEKYGAENAAIALNSQYQQLMSRPKTKRVWGLDAWKSLIDNEICYATVNENGIHHEGSEIFCESAGRLGKVFRTSVGQGVQAIEADLEIFNMGHFVHDVGIMPYLVEFGNDPNLWFWSGLQWLARGGTDQAVHAFIHASQCGKTDWRVHAALKVAAQYAGNDKLVAEAQSNLHKTKISPDISELYESKLLRIKEKNTEVDTEELQKCAEKYISENRWAEAASVLVELWEKAGDSTAIFESLAACSIESGDLESASTWLKRAINQDSCASVNFYQLSRIEHARGHIKEALKYAAEYENLEPDRIQGFDAYYGQLLRESGDVRSGARTLFRAIQSNPEDWYSSVQLAYCLMEMGEKKAARDMAEHVLNLKSDYQPAQELLRLLEREGFDCSRPDLDIENSQDKSGRRIEDTSDLSTEEIEERIRECESQEPSRQEYSLYRLAERNPQNPLVWEALGVYELKGGKLKAARSHFEKSRCIDSERESIWTYLAQTALAEGNVTDLENCLEKAFKINPESIDGNHILGLLLLEQGNVVDASRIFHHLITLQPYNKEFYTGLRNCFIRSGDDSMVACIDQRMKELDRALGEGTENVVMNHTNPKEEGVIVPDRYGDYDDESLSEVLNNDYEYEVSVIVSTYNNEKLIRGCLNDLVRQTLFSRLEIIVIDSGSQEGEGSIVEEFAQQYKNIKYLRTQRESLYEAWNRGIRVSKGRYITNANTDDSHRPDALEKLVLALESNLECDLAYGDVYWTDRVNDVFEDPSIIRDVRYQDFDPVEVMIFCPTGCHPMWRRDVFNRIGVFNGEYKVVGDYEFLMRFVRAGLKAVHVPEFLSLFYQNSTGLSQGDNGAGRELEKLYKKYRSEMPVESLFQITRQPVSPVEKAYLWASLGTRIGRGIKVPWIDKEIEDYKYSIFCFEQALEYNNQLWAARVNLCYVATLTDNQELLNVHLPLIPENKRQYVIDGIKSRHLLWEPFAVCSIDYAGHEDKWSQSGEDEICIESGFSLPLRWHGPMYNESGFTSEAHMFLQTLWSSGIKPGIHNIGLKISDGFLRGLPVKDRGRLYSMRDRYVDMTRGIIVQTGDTNLSSLTGSDYLVGRVMFETENLPTEWVRRCNLMDELWVTGTPQYEAYLRSGVPEHKLHILNGGVDERLYNPDKASIVNLETGTKYNFFAIFEWIYRKGWDVLLEAYIREFSHEDDVTLIMRTYLPGVGTKGIKLKVDSEIARIAKKVGKPLTRIPRIKIVDKVLSVGELASYYKTVDCVVSPSRGEGWGRPQQEAMLMGVPVIATGWGGSMEFMRSDCNYFIDYDLVPVRGVEAVYWDYTESRWAEPKTDHLCQLMRHVYEHSDEAKRIGFNARDHILKNFSRRKVVTQLIRHLERIQDQVKCKVPVRMDLNGDPRYRVLDKPVSKLDEESKKAKNRLRIVLEGSYTDYGSLSKVNREISNGLSMMNDVHLTRAITSQMDGKVREEMKRVGMRESQFCRAGSASGDFIIRHNWPPDWSDVEKGQLVMIQPWEFGRLPRQWVQNVNTGNLEEVWCYSRFVMNSYIDSGVLPSKLRLMPLGVDTQLFQPEGEKFREVTDKKFKFLFVGGTIHRKGPDILLESYIKAFSSMDDVCLIIKDFGGGSVYEGQTFGKTISRMMADPGNPEIVYLDEELSDIEMGMLYRSCHCLVHPYRGEGFGLPVIEAMASGLPVIVTGGGSTDDFVPDSAGWKINSTRKFIGESVSNLSLMGEGWLLEPDKDMLTGILRNVYEMGDEIKNYGSYARSYVCENFSWQVVCDRIVHALHEIRQKKTEKDRKNSQASKSFRTPPVAYVGNLMDACKAYKSGDYATSWRLTSEAIRVRPFHPEAYLLLSKVCIMRKEYSKAIYYSDVVTSMAPGYAEGRKLKKELRRNSRFSGDSSNRVGGENINQLIDDKINKKLSVCIITKNEEENIGRCLRSVSGIADEVIVVDTGSTDKTKQIAGEYGARLEEFAWCDDFSAARNKSLELATGEWILILDADEELPESSCSILLDDLERSEVMAYRLPLIDVGREEDGRSFVPRLFRNAPGLFFAGRIHEQIFSSVEVRRAEWGLSNQFSEAVLKHYGYSEQMTSSRDKINRNLKLLEMALEELPGEPNLLMNLGMELCRGGNSYTGIGYYFKALDAAVQLPTEQLTPELCETLFNQITTYLLKSRNYYDIINLSRYRLAKVKGLTSSAWFNVGLACMETRKYEDAIEAFTKCIEKKGQMTYAPQNPEVQRGGPYHCLGMCYIKLGKSKEAIESYVLALRYAVDAGRISEDLIKIARSENLHVEAIELLNKHMFDGPGARLMWRAGALLSCDQFGTYSFGQEWVEEGLKYFPADSELETVRMRILIGLGRLAEAKLCLDEGYSGQYDQRIFAGIIWVQHFCGVEVSSCGDGEEPGISREMLQWYRVWVERGFEVLIRRLNERMDTLAEKYPGVAKPLMRMMAELAI